MIRGIRPKGRGSYRALFIYSSPLVASRCIIRSAAPPNQKFVATIDAANRTLTESIGMNVNTANLPCVGYCLRSYPIKWGGIVALVRSGSLCRGIVTARYRHRKLAATHKTINATTAKTKSPSCTRCRFLSRSFAGSRLSYPRQSMFMTQTRGESRAISDSKSSSR
jgi:hypothetical protein